MRCSCGPLAGVGRARWTASLSLFLHGFPMAKWRVIRKQKTFGPFTDDQLQKLAASGKLKPEDGVQREGSDHIVKAKTIRELWPQQTPAERPPEPASAPKPAADPWFTQDEMRKIGTVCLGIVIFGFVGIRSCNRIKDAAGVLASSPKIRTEDDIYALSLIGKSQQEVMKMLGKPDRVHKAGRLVDGTLYEQSWRYDDMLKHPVTGHSQNLQIFFSGRNQVIGWDVDF